MLIKRNGIYREVSKVDFPRFHALGFEEVPEVVEIPKESLETEKELDLDELTGSELRALCDEKGLEYAQRWGKDKLKELLRA